MIDILDSDWFKFQPIKIGLEAHNFCENNFHILFRQGNKRPLLADRRPAESSLNIPILYHLSRFCLFFPSEQDIRNIYRNLHDLRQPSHASSFLIHGKKTTLFLANLFTVLLIMSIKLTYYNTSITYTHWLLSQNKVFQSVLSCFRLFFG